MSGYLTWKLNRLRTMRGAELGDMDLELRVLAHEHARGAGVVEVDVAEEQVAQVRELEAVLLEPSFERRDAARGPAVEEREPVVGLEEVAPDDPLGAAMVEVD